MEDKELETMLDSYKNQSGETWLMNVMQLNMAMLESIQTRKARSKLKKLAAFKFIVIVLDIAWVLFLGRLVYFVNLRNIYFTVSVSMIIIFNLAAIIVYIRHLVLIAQINYSGSITETQQKLAVLRLSTVNIVRILFLQTPFYATAFWVPFRADLSNSLFWLITIPVTLILTLISFWLYRNISLKNANRKWFKILFSSIEWTAITQSMEFIKVIDDFKNEQ